MPFKRYDISLSYRGKRPSPGRFRGFYQCDVDTVGRHLSLDNDAQCISALVQGLTALLDNGIESPADRNFTMYLNHIGIPKSMLRDFKVSEENIPEALRIIDKMEKIGVKEVGKQLKELLAEKVDADSVDALVDFFAFKGKLEDFQPPLATFPEQATKGLEDLKTIFCKLEASGVPAERLHFCPGMVRGLDYYTGVVFETFLDALPKAGSVMSGGRYDGLVDTFTKKEMGIEGVGGSIGLTRLYDVLQGGGLIKPTVKTAAKVMIVSCGNFGATPMKIASAVRKEGIPCDIYTGNAKRLGKQLEFANQTGVPVALMIFGENTFAVRDMRAKVQSEDLSEIEACVNKVRELLGY